MRAASTTVGSRRDTPRGPFARRTILLYRRKRSGDKRFMRVEIEEAAFTPAEAERITGVNVMTQRRLRHEGRFPKSGEGWTRWQAVDLAQLLALGRLASWVGPAKASALLGPTTGKSLASLVYLYALAEPGASEGVHVVLDRDLPLFAISHGDEPMRLVRSLDDEVSGNRAALVLSVKGLGADLAAAAGRPLKVSREIRE